MTSNNVNFVNIGAVGGGGGSPLSPLLRRDLSKLYTFLQALRNVGNAVCM